MLTEPIIETGILSSGKIEFSFNGNFICSNHLIYNDKHTAVYQNNEIFFDGKRYAQLSFTPENTGDFTLFDVVIGKQFHWERRENQRFAGSLRFIVEDGMLTAINAIGLEQYLESVISSEMSANASVELLKTHAVISRSWALNAIHAKNNRSETIINSKGKILKWYERTAHTHFDVCADDHCQRYQGITRQTTERARQAVLSTRGETLMYNGTVCDARFSKCCGGITEEFENCWADKHFPYLQSVADAPESRHPLPAVTSEKDFAAFLHHPPKNCFCHTQDQNILSQVLNDYDRETTDFFRWKKTFTQKEISALIGRKSGIDFGEIIDLQPIKRGKSGRIVELKIIGTKQTLTVGKELEIRKWLSESHLYSSAFIVERANVEENIPQSFTLRGAGWGHGVGLCQIGAAMMGAQGYAYIDILAHYFRQASLEKLY